MRIVLDLDDVLNNLSLELLRFDGIHFQGYDEVVHWPWGYDIIGAASDLTSQPRMGIVEYWERIPRDLWANCELSDDCYSVIDFCKEKVGWDNILIATSPTKCAECLAGKYDWIEKFLPEQLQRQWAITPRKWWFGHEDCILIDDLPDNCRRFEELGGQSINVPRPWNSLFGFDVMDSIEDQWEALNEAYC